MKIQIIKYCLTLTLLLGNAGEIFAQGEWFQTEKPNCLVWNPDPSVGETVTWSGDCLNGKAHGIGIKVWRFKKSGKWVERPVVGNSLNGRMSGEVTVFYENGDKYVGMLHSNGNRNGQGTYTYQNGRVEEGIWKDSKFQYANKPTKPAPVAKIATRTGVDSSLPDCPSDTDWRSWKLCFGTRIWGQETKWAGDKYVGEWLNMARHGQGTYTFSGGDQYIGDFKHDNYNGQGKYTHLGGKVEEGTWKDSELNGQATVTYPDGTVKEGIWKNDVFQYQKVSSVASCLNNVSQCSNNFLCSQGTVRFQNIPQWNFSVDVYEYVLEAKKRGLSCGVAEVTSFTPESPPTCTDNIGTCDDSFLCSQGTFKSKNIFKWEERLLYSKYVVEAKKRGLTCGIGSINSSQVAGATNLPDCPKNVWHSCFGTKIWADGSKYAGEWKENKKNGQGTMTFASGSSYVGDWKNDKRTGQGVYTSVSGSIYEGEYKDNKWNGQGTFTYGPKTKWAGDKYVGGWKNDKRNGKGKYTYADGTVKEGIWEDGKLQGLKTASAEPNAVSNLPDCPSGKNVRWHKCFGNYTYDNGNKYVGEWKDNQKTGQGIFTWKSGNIYVGQFKDNKNTGQGILTFASGDKYSGGFKDSSFYGQGTYTYKSGRVDKGTWKDGKLNGQAIVTFVNGNKYVGEFKDDKRTKGTYTFASGDKYVGGWRDGKRHGQGTYTFADGTVRDGTWKDGEFEYAKTPTKPVPVVKAPTQNDQAIPASSGSGFAVSSAGYVMTNSHVIDGCQDVFIHTPEKDVRMRVISNDPKNDLALLKGNFKPLAVFSLSSKRPEILQDIYVAGYPFGYKVSSSVKVTKGIISSLTGIGNDFSNMQIDAALQSGNSGGPILDDMGNVVGVAVAKLDAMQMLKDTGSIPENTNFGIKASVVKSVLDSSSVNTPAANKSPISKSQLGKMITDGTYYISCWMTMAQIEKVRSKKVLFSELD
ncbi:trypsin-like peptidase domain-containing protein [Candidatus Njordibacter sp. Uisw_058]|uniref:trypsin-like peptidase domain-containing protein n=1 Tax=Candidatus Njordibacter sp. Uisw_058 TaxID=3230974 RepID=UPI003D59EC2D